MRLNRMALVLACFSLAFPQTASAAEGTAKQQVSDVSLRADGVLVGHVTNSLGEAVPAAKVTVYHGQEVIAQTTSDNTGGFIVRKLRGGVHQVKAEQGVSVVRLWTTQAAPPASLATLTVVSDENPVSGQSHDPNCTGGCDDGCAEGVGGLGVGFFGGGLAGTAGIIATAAVIGGVLAVVLDDDDDGPSSP
jgi:hypothetical protein